MDCPHCQSKCITQLKQKTQLGYLQHRCHQCGKQFNEQTGKKLNFIEYPTEVVMIAVQNIKAQNGFLKPFITL